ncbi:MAG TPA: diaminopimelate epimerase [Cellvibrionales bacterium]|jgi:diaminopimelate epimerase|nr:diaminopimelate epimerase [Cellvibrionales bacterium]HCX26407.1 diaminopimelate epimerase [Cellvibrionales bacterium]
MQLRFTKMHGLGNDFVVIDLLSQNAQLSPDHIRHIANRHLGIGCDQVLLVEPPTTTDTDFHYRIYNCDGTEVEQCGNGARCFGKFVTDKKLTGKRQLKVSTNTGLINIDVVDNNTFRVDMGVPNFDPASLPFTPDLALANDTQTNTYTINHTQGSSDISIASMGNPHAVLVVDNIDTADVAGLGKVLECHSQFPNNVNVGFMQIISRNRVKLRVFERGVGETQACGSGACAAVATGINNGLLDAGVDVELIGGQLNIQWSGGNTPLIMTGSATKVFDGKMTL